MFKSIRDRNFIGLWFILIMFILLGSFTCYKQNQSEKEYVGTWLNETAKIQVRTKTGIIKYKFTPITVPISLTILSQSTATCKIGEIETNNLVVTRNSGNAEKTGVIYIIKLGEIGLINNTDPLSKKEIQLWIKPLTKANKLHLEIRQMGTLDAFPMGEVVLEKEKIN